MNSLNSQEDIPSPLFSLLTLTKRLFVVLLFLSLPLGAFFFSSNQSAADPGQILGASDADLTTESKFTSLTSKSTQEIAFTTQIIESDELEIGQEETVQEGQTGLAEVVTTQLYYDEQLYETKTDKITVKEATNEIITQGTKIVTRELETSDGELTYTRKLENFWATSYDSTCRGCSDTTATGMKAGYGVVAVDPSVIPLYTKLYVPGYGTAIAGDVGGAVKGNIIDLGFDSLNGQWSTRYVDVYILED